MGPSESQKSILKSKSRTLLKELNEPSVSLFSPAVKTLNKMKSKGKISDIIPKSEAAPVRTLSKSKGHVSLLNNDLQPKHTDNLKATLGLSKSSSSKCLNGAKTNFKQYSGVSLEGDESPKKINVSKTMVKSKNKSKVTLNEDLRIPSLTRSRSRPRLKNVNEAIHDITDTKLCSKGVTCDCREIGLSGDRIGVNQLEKTLSLVELEQACDTPTKCPPSPKVLPKISSILKSSKNQTSSRRQSRKDLMAMKEIETPQTVKVGRIGFNDETVFYFPRSIGHCSVPRMGSSSIGMEMRHSMMERRKLNQEQNFPAKRKLFNIGMGISDTVDSSLVPKEIVDNSNLKYGCGEQIVPEGETRTLTPVKSCPELGQKFLTLYEDDDDLEIIFKSQGKTDQIVEPEDEISSNTSESNGQNPSTSHVKNGSQSPAFKRSLSRSVSEDSLSPRRLSVTQYPPTKAHKGTFTIPEQSSMLSGIPSTPSTDLTSYRSSPRLLSSVNKSTNNLLNNNIWPGTPFKQPPEVVSTPKQAGKVGKRNDSLRKSAMKNLSRVDLKLSFNEIESTDSSSVGLVRPNKEFAKSISTSSLKSFQSYHTSPESKTILEEDEEQPIKSLVRAPSCKSTSQLGQLKPENQAANTNSDEQKRGTNRKKKKAGECGTRGLTPLTARARCSILKANGIDLGNLQERTEENEDLDRLRDSRTKCGCSCPGGKCLPETCECALNGIECQVERTGFPCQCSAKLCENPQGRREFNEMEVSMHFIDTMMNMRGVLDISLEPESEKVTAS